ncbi:hypothetical protein GJ744_009264 [Endocarpon pusillum]|uniref:C2H2-type domain-containing protein n=1 Tax=Endocarpon pusillum TaxID=364733 RepID=A0A8H7AJT3_9EURO|nr:hypothetical protein GJ744_009264 [Endocarpon pusillum]
MDNNHFAEAELNGNYDDLFDFEAASCNTHHPAQQAHTIGNGGCNPIVPLTETEIQSILMGASNAQNPDLSNSLTPAGLNNGFDGFEEPSAHGAWLNCDGAGKPSPAHPSEFSMADYGDSSPSKQPHFKEPGDVFRAFNDSDFVPNDTNQLSPARSGSGVCAYGGAPRNINPPSAPIIHDMNQSIRAQIAPSPVQTQGFVEQPLDFNRLLDVWSIGSKCNWPNCTSTAKFKTVADFRMHATNIHIKPLLCLTAGCPHKKPFGRHSDLRRHKQSAHSSERKFVCTFPFCDASIKEFARNDHLSKHMRERHDHYYCPKTHCLRSTKSCFAKPEDVEEHINLEHGPYECAVLACAQAPSSGFYERSLKSHLMNHHSTTDTAFMEVQRVMGRAGKTTITKADLHGFRLSECKVCKKGHSVNND